MANKVCILMQGHVATTPRMLKAADAIAAAGYETCVVSARYIPWAVEADEVIRGEQRDAPWTWDVVDWSKANQPARYYWTSVRYRTASKIARVLGIDRAPLAIVKRARERACLELESTVLRVAPDFVYGGGGTLATTSSAATRLGIPYALDLEDYHSGEGADTPLGRFLDATATRIEREVLPGAAFRTGGSDAISAEYEQTYGVPVTPINNVFDLPAPPDPEAPRAAGPLRLYWFSQTIGPGRGLEDAVLAVSESGIEATLALRGRVDPDYQRQLLEFAAAHADAERLSIEFLEIEPPDRMIDLCREHDVGLALDRPVSRNAELLLSNKALTYVLAGLPIVITDTPGHAPLANSLGAGALRYAPEAIASLKTGLREWSENPEALAAARRASWQAARDRWHWAHPKERGALLAALRDAIGPPA